MIILATNNHGKISELTSLLQPRQCVAQSALNIPDIEETYLTFIENALLKARHASKIGKAPALADDSGLVVPALNGEPGIYSARYAKRVNSQESNLKYLLSRMQGLTGSQRQAYFYCVIVYLERFDSPTPLIAIGRWDGVISDTCAGEGGFGYDPLFYIPKLQCTAAQLDCDTKNLISHRAQALFQLREALNDK